VALPGGKILRPAPTFNAGTLALQEYMARRLAYSPASSASPEDAWAAALDPLAGLPALHARLFGSPWPRSQAFGPLFPAGLAQPELLLPFASGQSWSFTGGPHAAWGSGGALAALDFAPTGNSPGCAPSAAWVTAVAAGPVVRSQAGVVVQDLDTAEKSDGSELTGWAVLYLHIAEEGRAALGTALQAGDRIGHPSCEGGAATGTHVHIARKYNGEWTPVGEAPAGGPLPFVLGGWTASAGARPYQGSLANGERVIVANSNSPAGSLISRP
jgi:hypothetical protein